MILADTSIWIDHFRRGNDELAEQLEKANICIHPYIIGELACGNIRDRYKTLSLLESLQAVDIISHKEAIAYIEMHNLYALGLGYIDVHLLASCQIFGARLWTMDKRLQNAAKFLSA